MTVRSSNAPLQRTPSPVTLETKTTVLIIHALQIIDRISRYLFRTSYSSKQANDLGPTIEETPLAIPLVAVIVVNGELPQNRSPRGFPIIDNGHLICATQDGSGTSNNRALDLLMVLKLIVAPRKHTRNHKRQTHNSGRKLPLLRLAVSGLNAKTLRGANGVRQLPCKVLVNQIDVGDFPRREEAQ